MGRAQAYVCCGKSCCRSAGHDELLASLGRVADTHTVRCQKLCDGPVVGACLDGRNEWFEKVGKPKQRSAVVEAVQSGSGKSLKKRLAKRRVVKLSGRQPR